MKKFFVEVGEIKFLRAHSRGNKEKLVDIIFSPVK